MLKWNSKFDNIFSMFVHMYTISHLYTYIEFDHRIFDVNYYASHIHRKHILRSVISVKEFY